MWEREGEGRGGEVDVVEVPDGEREREGGREREGVEGGWVGCCVGEEGREEEGGRRRVVVEILHIIAERRVLMRTGEGKKFCGQTS